jgi:hypothetical protein
MLTADQVCGANAESTTVETPLNDPEPVVIVVEDRPQLAQALRPICDFVRVRVAAIATDADIPAVIEAFQPITMVVACHGERSGQVLGAIARHRANLPTLLVGCGEAIERFAQLQHVLWFRGSPPPCDVADFLFHACRMRAGRQLMAL